MSIHETHHCHVPVCDLCREWAGRLVFHSSDRVSGANPRDFSRVVQAPMGRLWSDETLDCADTVYSLCMTVRIDLVKTAALCFAVLRDYCVDADDSCIYTDLCIYIFVKRHRDRKKTQSRQ